MRHPDGTAALTMSHNMTNGDEILCVARVQATSARGGGPGLGASWRRSSRSCAARRCRCRCSWAYLPTRHPDGTAALTMSHTADSDEDPLRCACAGDECARQWPRTGPILAAQFSVACGLPLTALLLKGLPTRHPDGAAALALDHMINSDKLLYLARMQATSARGGGRAQGASWRRSSQSRAGCR